MKFKIQRQAHISFISGICALIFVLSLAGCGYTIQGRSSLPFDSISIGNIVNKTFEPKLQDRMQTALADELLKNGFKLESNSPYRINGIINAFEMRTLSEKSGTAIEYEVIIKGDFKLTEPSGRTRDLRNHGVFIVSFSSSDSLQSVIASKEKAIEKALKDFSSEIAASIIYQ